MNDSEILEMLSRIDEGIQLAQYRLYIRSRKDMESMIVFRDGKVMEYIPE